MSSCLHKPSPLSRVLCSPLLVTPAEALSREEVHPGSQHGSCTLFCQLRALSLERGWHAVGWPPNSAPAAARPQTVCPAGELLTHPRPAVWRYRINLLQNPVTGHFWRMKKSLFYFVWGMPLPLLRRMDIPVSMACRPQSPKLSLPAAVQNPPW